MKTTSNFKDSKERSTTVIIPQIFPIYFSDSNLKALRCIYECLTYNLSEITVHTTLHDKSNLIFMSQTMLDFKEMLNYKNTKGYRYNCLILRSLIVKLSFLIATFNEDILSKFNEEIESIDFMILQLDIIITTHYFQQKNSN